MVTEMDIHGQMLLIGWQPHLEQQNLITEIERHAAQKSRPTHAASLRPCLRYKLGRASAHIGTLP